MSDKRLNQSERLRDLTTILSDLFGIRKKSGIHKTSLSTQNERKTSRFHRGCSLAGLGLDTSIPGPKISNFAKTGSSLTFIILKVRAQSKVQPDKFGNRFGLMQCLNAFLASFIDFSASSQLRKEVSHS